MSNFFIDGDFPSGKGDCQFHCSPTCHPMQIGPEWVYGCTHKAWPMNRYGDFCPIVECGGNVSNCDLKRKEFRKFAVNYRRGKVNSMNYSYKKIEGLINEIKQCDMILKKGGIK